MSRDAIVERAAQLLDERSPDGFNLATLAESFGVRVPSLYKHIDGMPGLRRALMLRAKEKLAHTLGQAAIGRSRDAAITRMSFAYRRWAIRHPAQYPMTVHAPAAGDDEDLTVSAAMADVIYNVLAGYDLRDDDGVDATRFLRSALHGFVALETSGAFELPVDLDRSFERLVESIVTALSAWSRS